MQIAHTGIVRRVADFHAADVLDKELHLASLRLDLIDWDLAGLQQEVPALLEGLTALGQRGIATAEYIIDATKGVRRLFWIEIRNILVQIKLAQRLGAI